MLENIIKTRTESRLESTVVKELFSAYCQFSILSEVSGILETVPQETREPIIYTLGSHVTKEKPIFVYSTLQSVSEVSEKKASQIAATVDLLWSLSLMYDDMFDQDLKRSGFPAAWIKFGGDKTYKSAYAGFEAVKKMSDLNFGDESVKQIDKYVGAGLASLKSHKELKAGTSVNKLMDNYRQRALFHCALPFVLINQVPNQDNQAFLAIENVNLAGQILNDLKDISPKYVWLREGFSDIRSGVMSVPFAILLKKLPDIDKAKILSIFGKNPLSQEDKQYIIDMFVQSKALTDSIKLTRSIYEASFSQFYSTLKPQFWVYTKNWIDYKLKQLEDLI